MKKSNGIIKSALKTVVVLAGIVAFLCLLGEPTDEWYAWAEKSFGSLSVAWFFAEKILLGTFIYALVKFYERIEPNAFVDNIKHSTTQEYHE